MRNYDPQENIKEIGDLLYAISGGAMSFAKAAQKAGVNVEELSDMLSDIVAENSPKSRFRDLPSQLDYEQLITTDYNAGRLKRMDRVLNANRVIVLPVAVGRYGSKVYVSPCVINLDTLDHELTYCEISADPYILEDGTAMAGGIFFTTGRIEWLNKRVYEDCRQAALFLTMSGIEVYMPKAIENGEYLDSSSAETVSIDLTCLPKALFVASLTRLKENAHKELNLSESGDK